MRRLIFILFFFSGLAALVYEVVWARKLSLIFGTTTYAVSSILAVFFSGLALGSWLFGKIADKRLGWISAERFPLVLYGLLEVGIGLYAFLTPWIFKLIENLQVSFWQKFSPTYFAETSSAYSGFSLFTFGLSFLCLIIPTTLMGGTLPVLSKFWVRRKEEIGGGVGALYFINTAGAVLGAFLAGFLLIATIGVNETILTAAVVNLIIGGIVLYLSRIKANTAARGGLKRIQTNERISSFAPIRSQFAQISVLITFGLAGFAAMALEVLWTRVLVMVFGGSVYAFTVVLVAFLVGIALGSAISARLVDRLRNILIWFAGIEILLGISIILLSPFLGELPFWFLGIYKNFSQSFLNLQFGLFLLSFLVMILPTFLMGMAFPVVVKAYLRIQTNERIGSDVGKVYAANTVGGVFGSLAAGFILIPFLGLQKGIWLMAAIYLVVGGGIIFLTNLGKFVKILISFFMFLFILIGFLLPSWNKLFLVVGFYREPYFYLDKEKKEIKKELSATKIIFYKEGLGATISVTKNVYENNLSLRINGKTDASISNDMENQILLGHLPMFFHPEPKEVLVIGLGSGVTLGSVEQYPVESIDMVEIEPAVIEAASFFADYNHHALEDPRMNLVIADGRNFLLQAQGKQYDVITSEPSNLWLAGVSNLFTKEFYQLAKEHLKEDGVMVQWFHLYAMEEEDLKTAIGTFYEVFPEALAFNVFSSNDILLVGGKEKLTLDLEQIKTWMKQEKVKADLDRVAIKDPVEVLAYLTLDKEAIGRFSQGTSLNTDNQPILEFSAPKSLYSPTQAGNLRKIMECWTDLSDLTGENIKEFRQHFAKMMIAYTENNLDEAIREGEEALKIRENLGVKRHLSLFYSERAYYLLKEQKGQEAKKDFLRSLEILPTSQARINLGSIFGDEGRLDLAKEQFEEAIKDSPELQLAHFNLGLVLEQTGDLNRAIEEFERVLELDPEYSHAHEELAKLYELRGDYGKAKKHKEKIY